MNALAMTLDRAVRSLCPDVAMRVGGPKSRKLSEHRLWEELACCLLSSQVKYESATAAASQLRRSGVFGDIYSDITDRKLKTVVARILREPLNIHGRSFHYRFPTSRAHQLIRSRRNLITSEMTLTDIVYSDETESRKRRLLIELICGFGPKQSSMFLRACGVSYDLAILDRHALNFMFLTKLSDDVAPTSYLTINRYEHLEADFGVYANCVGYPVGYVDWAVWIVMRALGALRK